MLNTVVVGWQECQWNLHCSDGRFSLLNMLYINGLHFAILLCQDIGELCTETVFKHTEPQCSQSIYFRISSGIC